MSKEEPKPAETIFVTGLVSSRTMGPRVQIEIGDVKTQVTADKAKEIAVMILEASEAAMSDSFLVRFFAEKTGAKTDGAIGVILNDFRQFREEKRRESEEENK